MHSSESGNIDKLQKTYRSIKDFKSLIETPETKPLCLITSKGFIQYCNQSFTNLFSIKEGSEISNMATEPAIDLFISGLAQSIYSSFHFEIFLLNKPTNYPINYYVDVDRVVVNNEELMVLIFTSGTERRKIEDRINNLHNALEYGDVAVIITDDKGIINYSSRSFDDMLKSSIEYLYNQFLPDVLSEFLSEDDTLNIKHAIINKKEWFKTVSFVDGKGKIIYREIKLNPILKSYSDSVNFIVTAHDITAYIQKNQLILRSAERQKLIINNISDPVLIIREENGQKFFENANEVFYEEFNLIKKDLLSKELSLIECHFMAHLKDSIELLDKSGTDILKFNYVDQNSKKEYLGKINRADEIYNKIRLYIANYTDLTEQLKAQEQLRIAYEKEIQVSRLKSTFLANMSHEFRTPLNAIAGYSDLLEDDLKNKEYDSVEEYTAYLKDGVQRLVKLVENILEISILESGGDDFDFEKTSVNFIVRNIHNLYLSKIKNKSLSFDLDLDGLEPYIFIDESKLTKILDSLIDNSIKYNVQNGMILIRTRVVDDSVNIEVSDSGIGIEEAKLDKILKPFEQETDLGHTRSYEGAGLGLTIAHRLTKRLGGDFGIFSQLNEGTVISLKFPLLKK